MTKYRVVKEEVLPDAYTYYPEYKRLFWWLRFEEHLGPFQYAPISFSHFTEAKDFIDRQKEKRFKPVREVFWEDK